jgi:hypothetical protein
MKMVLENDIAVKQEMSLLMKESPGIEDDLNRLGPSEYRNPADDRAGEEVGILGFENSVACPAHGSVIEGNGVSKKGVPKREFGNEERKPTCH